MNNFAIFNVPRMAFRLIIFGISSIPIFSRFVESDFVIKPVAPTDIGTISNE